MMMPEAPTMSRHFTFCRICESLCGLEVEVDEGEVVAIRPDRQHIATEGFACVKGIKQQRMYSSPDRLMHPLRRTETGAERATWEDANHEIGSKVRQLIDDHGPNSIGMYVGTAAGFSLLHPIFAQGFMEGIGSRNIFSSATQDCSNKFAAASAIYGFPFTQPMPDLDRTECLIIVGGNPVVSKWSFGQVPNPTKTLKQIGKRGGQVIVVDPRRTETAKIATDYVPIRPGTDIWFYLGFANEICTREGWDSHRVNDSITGFEAFQKAVAPYSPERCAEHTQIPADDLRNLVTAYLEADGAALYCSTGVNMGGHGALCFWLQESINAIAGNLDRAGGTLVPEGVFDFARFGKRANLFVKEERSRIGDLPSINDAFPGGILADEILTPGPGQIRALFVTGGNPLLTMANGERLREAFESLELLVILDIFENETASLAHWILPCTSPLQRPDLPFAFPLFMGMQKRPYLQATEAILPPKGEQRSEATIYHDLMVASGVGIYGSKAATWALHQARKWLGEVPQRGLMSGLLRITGQGSFSKLVQHPHGRPRPDHRPGSFLDGRIVTEDGRVHVAPPAYLDELSRLQAPETGTLRLITKRAVRTHNSWTHNLSDFVGPKRRTNLLYMHPNDATERHLEEGDLVDVRSSVNTLRLPVTLNADLMPGVVALPHGWGHQGARGLSVASKTEGVNVNLLAEDGPQGVCRLSGMARLTGIPVTVQPADGPKDADNWSGRPPSTPAP